MKFRPGTAIAWTLCSVFVFALITQLANAASQKTEDVFVLTSRDINLGHMQTFIGKSGVRVTMDNHKCVLVASTPLWRTSYFNPSSKLIYHRDYASLKKNPLFSWDVDVNAPLFKPGPNKVVIEHDMPALKLERDENVLLQDGMFQAVREKPRYCKKIEYYTYIDKEKRLPPDSVNFIATMIGFPLVGLPLSFYYYDSNNSRRHSVMVSYSLKTATIPISDFEAPKGYKEARTELDVASNNRTQLMDVWAPDMGQADKVDGKHKSTAGTKTKSRTGH